MWLDQYAHKVKGTHNLPSVDAQFSLYNETTGDWGRLVPEEDVHEIHYWRMHHDLQGWMQNLYNKKGGVDSQFNCCKVELTLEDIDDLEYSVESNFLPPISGFFFGSDNMDYYKDETLAFCKKARDAINEGFRVFYDSLW